MNRRKFIKIPVIVGSLSIFKYSSSLVAQAADENLPNSNPIIPPHTVTGINIELSEIDVAKDKPTIIWADRLIINGRINTFGNDLSIYARDIVFKRKSKLNLSGLPAVIDYTKESKAQGGLSPGAHGSNGGNGDDGNMAGALLIVANTINGKIVADAHGSNGGGAESGGNGAQGQSAGTQGVNCSKGLTGQKGGNAGSAGKPGDGGNGGVINVYIFDVKNKHELNVMGGLSGNPGIHGRPGAGGNGGPGGGDNWIETDHIGGEGGGNRG